MKCQLCANAATVHFTKIVKQKVTEFHLCAGCAAKKQIPSLGELSLSAILQTLIGPHLGPQSEELSRLTCSRCGLKYMEFRREGRLGCPADYMAFHLGLAPILQKVHRSVRHLGKVPRRRRDPARGDELLTLRQLLRHAIQAEEFEEAARLRDLIRQKESSHEPG